MPFKDDPKLTIEEYESQKSQIHNTRDNKQTRASDRRDRSQPFFQIINCHQVPFKLSYSDVVATLMRMLVILYNKLNEINFTKGNDFRSLTALLKRMDEHIMGKCLILVVEDLNRVAKRKAQTSLT